MTRLLIGFTLVASILAFATFSQAQTRSGANEPVGMVIDVQGAVTLTEAGKNSRLEALSYLRTQNEILLSAGATITVTWYAGSKELRFAGPARLKVEPQGIRVTQGAPGQERVLAEEKITPTKYLPPRLDGRLDQAGVRMRMAGPRPKAKEGELEAQREKLRPADGAPFGDWVVYALALEQMGLTGEARGVWRNLSAQRPDDSRLRLLAR